MLRVLAALLLASAASAQVVIDQGKLPAPFRDFQAHGEPQLRCAVEPIKPLLNFGFRFQAGYVVRVPMNQFSGKGQRWVMLMKITPEAGGRPVFLASAVGLPEVPPGTKAQGEIAGGYLLGEGRYRVDWLLTENKGRVCRKSWKVVVRLKRGERTVKLAMAPDSVSELSLRGTASRAPADEDVRRLRLTVLLHAAPLSFRRTRMRASDRIVLLGALAALLEQLPTRHVRLALFNLDQQKELLRQDGFTLDGIDRVAQSMNEVELGTVDYRVLMNRRGHLELLAGLVNREVEDGTPDAVVVLGPPARYWEKMPQDAVEKPAGPGVRFFNFQLQPYMRAMPVFPDAISYTVSRLRGKTTVIRSPGDFARAISQITGKVAGRN